MHNLKQKITIIVLSLVFSLNICSAYQINKHWGNTNDKYYTCSSTFTIEGKNAFSNANIAWNDVLNADINIYRSTPDNNATSISKNGRNEVIKKDLGDVELMGTATWLNSSNEVIEFDIQVNTYYNWSNSGTSGCYDVQDCATHEIGHALWSGDVVYSSDVQSQYSTQYEDVTMYKYMEVEPQQGMKRRTLHQDDKDGFINAY